MNIKTNIKNHSLSKNEEICGFVIQDSDNIKIYPVDNAAKDKKNTFIIPAKEYLYVEQNFKVLAIYHSHLESDTTPSEMDKKTCEAVHLPFIIYSKKTDDFSILFPDEYKDKQTIKLILHEN